MPLNRGDEVALPINYSDASCSFLRQNKLYKRYGLEIGSCVDFSITGIK